MMMHEPLDRLEKVLRGYDQIAVAVSGGVDSMTLAYCAKLWVPDFMSVHAVSPAVPPQATERVKEFSKRYEWNLKIIDSGEFGDQNYRANPYNRCYFCKKNLYGTIASTLGRTIASGTNLDDLGDYRPGLKAASEHDVVHPFVEAQIAKTDLREIARHFGLDNISELPAQPCLSSRVETGIAISEKDLTFIHKMENLLAIHVPTANLRCRVTHVGIRIESDIALEDQAMNAARQLCLEHKRRFAGVRDYRRGSAFIPETTGHG